jgi:capsular polysaccharide biosynthesis protein
LAILRSDNFAASFISKYNLTPQLIGDRFASSTADERLRYAVEIFSQDVLQVEENARAGLVTISVTWYEPINAARWANEIARYLNSVLRERAVLESETNIKYLTSQLSEIESSIVTQSVGRIIEQEMQKAMIAASAEDYAFQIIDRANVPIKPKNLEARWLILALSIIGASIGYWSCLLVSRKTRISGKSEGEISSLMSSKD